MICTFLETAAFQLSLKLLNIAIEYHKIGLMSMTKISLKNPSDFSKMAVLIRLCLYCFNTYFEYVLLAVERDLEQKFFDKFGKRPGVKFSYNIKTECDNNSRRNNIFTGKPSGTSWLLRLLYADDLNFFFQLYYKFVDIFQFCLTD